MKPTSVAFAILGGVSLIASAAGFLYGSDGWGYFLTVAVVLILAVR